MDKMKKEKERFAVDKIQKFDESYRNVCRDAFLYGKVSASVLCGIGMVFLMVPVEVLKYDPIGMAGFLFTGCIVSALGIWQYMMAYLVVRQDGKMMPLSEILKYMPVTKAQLRKVRLGYLNRFCRCLPVCCSLAAEPAIGILEIRYGSDCEVEACIKL